MTIDKRINFQGGGMSMGNASNQKQSASKANTTSRNTSSGTGGSKGNLGGGGGGQGTDYRQYSPPTAPTYNATNIDQKPVTGADFQRGENEFINNLNANNLFRSQQTNTPFVPYQGGARTTEYYNPNPFKGILSLVAGMAIPGGNFLMNQGGKLKDGIMSLNNQIQNSDFGRSKNLMDYLDMRKYGGFDEREMTRRINMDEAKLIQGDIDSGMYDGMGVRPVQTFEFDPTNFNTRNKIDNQNEYTSGTIPFDPAMTVGYGTGIESVNPEVPKYYASTSDLAPEFQSMATFAGNYSQNAVSNQLYGEDYDVLDPFTQQQIDSLIEQVGTKSTGELAGNDT